jgi:hypothetical protein
MRLISVTILGISLASCAAPDVTTDAASVSSVPWTFEAHAADLRADSCPEGVSFERAQPLAITAVEAASDGMSGHEAALDGAQLAGAWHLTANDPNFGGLSGLDVMRGGSLLAVSDAGAFVWIGIDPESGTPDGLGSIGYMRGADGAMLSGKKQGDSEGLAFRDGLALVSFEREHRIEAFDLEGCGVAARAALVANLPRRVDGQRVPENKGAEALMLFGDGQLRAGYEFRVSGGSPGALVMEDGSLNQIEYSGQPSDYLQVGIDREGDLTAQLFRAYDPLRGNRNLVYVYGPDGMVAKLTIAKPLPADNFEGVAFGKSPEGKTRLWLISDDNFNTEKQRTLLLAFDLDVS